MDLLPHRRARQGDAASIHLRSVAGMMTVVLLLLEFLRSPASNYEDRVGNWILVQDLVRFLYRYCALSGPHMDNSTNKKAIPTVEKDTTP